MKVVTLLFFIIFSIPLLAEKNNIPVNTSDISFHQLSEKTNLALRQTGHQLLLTTGNDSTSIPPVQQTADNVFLLKLAHSFNYDTLPFLLNKALFNFGIETNDYYVAIKDCKNDTLILGYNSLAFLNKNVSCIGREQYSNCNHIYLTFPNRKAQTLNNYSWVYLLLGAFFLGMVIYLFTKKEKKNTSQTPITKETIPITPPNTTSNLLKIGQVQLDISNQHLYINGEKKELTYREAKLLHFFGTHPNQLLERENILQKVWEEEGVIVGRSLDVFVSRLRKILKADTSLKIKNIHGMGYRLEIIA